MSIRKTIRMVRLAVGAMLFVGVTTGTASGEEINIVIPNALENVEGDTLGQTPAGADFRYQLLLLASEFGSLPETHRTIVGYYLRPDESVNDPRTVTYEDIQVRLSTTLKTPTDLETVFDNNLGDDVTTVYDGQWTGTTQATGSPGGPRGFDYWSPLQTPYVYDPTSGRNLLWDVVSFSGASAILFDDDYFTDSPVAVFGGAADSAGELINAGVAIQFVFVPEPSTLFMATLGLVGLAWLRVRLRISHS